MHGFRFFQYPNALLTVSLCTIELLFCFFAWRAFNPGDALCNAWLCLMLASGAHFTGRLISQVLFRIAGPAAGPVLYRVGVFFGGPAQMFLMLFGLLSVARICRRAGLVSRITAFDYVVLVLVAANAMHSIYEIREYITDGKPITWLQVLKWPADPLMIVLLTIAIPIRRSVVSMGRGFIASCWAAYVAAIVFVSLGDISLLLMRTTYIPWRFATLGWYVWFLADAAFALAPAYQVAAVERARFRSELSLAVSP